MSSFPLLGIVVTALRTSPMATRMPGKVLISAVGTRIETATPLGSATTHDGLRSRTVGGQDLRPVLATVAAYVGMPPAPEDSG